MEYSSWWRGMADLPSVVAGVAMVLTVVPSVGRGARRKWPNLVVIWQLGGGGERWWLREVYNWESGGVVWLKPGK